MNQIEDLPQGQFVVGIAQGNLIGQTALGQRIGKGGPHGARADNHHFSRFPTFIIHFCSSVAIQTVFGNENVKPFAWTSDCHPGGQGKINKPITHDPVLK